MAVYSLLASVNTVQVLSPTFVNPVLQCTIRTIPSGVIADMAIPTDATGVASGANPELQAYAESIEQIMADSRVIAGQGSQKLDANGLLSDTVIFTVEYIPPGTTGTNITGEATVPSASLNFQDGLIGSTLLQSVEAIIDGVYQSLQDAASG